MKSNKLLILASTFLLVACGGGQKVDPYKPTTKQINEETALARTKEICTHQDDPSFKHPNKLSVLKAESINVDNPKEGVHKIVLDQEASFNFDGLIYFMQMTNYTDKTKQKISQYELWKEGVYYNLVNDANGEKYRTEEKMTKSKAQQKLEDIYKIDIENWVTGHGDLKDFEKTATKDKNYKAKADESKYFTYDYRYGSDDNKSFERTINWDVDAPDCEVEGTKYKNYINRGKERKLWTNDLQKIEVSYSYKKEDYYDGKYSIYETEDQQNFLYGDEVKIKQPNINDYPLKK